MFNILKAIPLYIKVYKNKFEVLRLDSNTMISRKAMMSFSNQRLAIADFHHAEIALRKTIKELLESDQSILPVSKPLEIVFQQFELTEGGLSLVEKRALRDLGEHNGARKVVIAVQSRALQPSEALELLK